MGQLTSEVFNESCCDGGAVRHYESAQPCGCDAGAKWVCERHQGERATMSVTPVITPHQEVRVVDPLTGGIKGSKLARFSLIPPDFLWALAEHYGKGAQKYDDRIWQKGYKWSLSVDALNRHLAQWLGGEDNDPETGSSHLVAAAWHCIALWWWHKRALGTDDVREQHPAWRHAGGGL